jgi:hypothetical protein
MLLWQDTGIPQEQHAKKEYRKGQENNKGELLPRKWSPLGLKPEAP